MFYNENMKFVLSEMQENTNQIEKLVRKNQGLWDMLRKEEREQIVEDFARMTGGSSELKPGDFGRYGISTLQQKAGVSFGFAHRL